MTNREQELLELLRKNPLMSQQDIASLLGIERSSVAVHISNLIKKGIIKGKGYIIEDAPYILVIGGANMDILGTPLAKLRLEDSNPGHISMSFGGVGRNIAENLASFNIPVKLLTALGDDIYGERIFEQGKIKGIDMQHIKRVHGQQTSTYLSILDETGNMCLALSDMKITEEINIDYIDSKSHLIENAAYIILDTNLDTLVIDYIRSQFTNSKFIIDTVSTTKAKKIKGKLNNLLSIKPNLIEASMLLDLEIVNDIDIHQSLLAFKNQGIAFPIISLGNKGVAYLDENKLCFYQNREAKINNANGAGDSFTAALAYGFYHQEDIHSIIAIASTAALMTLESTETVNPHLTIEKINHILTNKSN